MDLALKHQNQFVVLSGTEEHLVMLILILLYRSWNIKYILSIMLHNQCYQFFYAKRLSQCFNRVFSEWYFLLFAPSTSICITVPRASFMQPTYAHQKCKLSSSTVRSTIHVSDWIWIAFYHIKQPVSRHTSPLESDLFWQSALHTILSPPSFLSDSSRRFRCPVFDSVGCSRGRAQMRSTVSWRAFRCSLPWPPLWSFSL